MRSRRWQIMLASTALVMAPVLAPPTAAQEAQSGAPVSFATTIKPLLARRCFACHGPDVANSGLRLHEHETALAELDSGGRAIVPGRPEESLLLERVTAEDEGQRMPPEGKPLSAEEVAALRSWIEQGAPWQEHWAFVPPVQPAPPDVEQRDWVANPIDAFILARLEAVGLRPNPEADKAVLVRRAYYNLTGLPPTREQLEEFVNDASPDAWQRLIDRLLTTPHYGEHWARHWLDLVRYAETNSYERDGVKPNAWKYRDYVIRSLNDDKPYDQFLREQLAGDELDEVTEDSIIATGYYRLGVWDDEPADPVQSRFDQWDDIISTTSQVMLGLTVACARCHDHKIDPIPQADYYGLLAFFADVTPYGEPGDQETNSQWDLSSPAEAAKRKALRKQERKIEREKTSMEEVGIRRMSAADQRRSETPERQKLLDEKLRRYLNQSEFEQYQMTLERLEAVRDKRRSLPPPSAALALARCDPRPEPTHLMVRGNPHVPGDVVEPHFPELFGDPTPDIPPAPDGARSAGRRRVLADWIASPDNLLTARVIVNRVWQHHFGRGIVRSSSNFGQLGTPPTHPELLDWLAIWFVEHDWQLKPLHRLIMTSNAYRMSSAAKAQALAMDPTNDLFWRFDMRRLSAEELHDTVQMVVGRFNPQMYGPSFYPTLSQEVLATQSRPGEGWGKSPARQRARRSVYMFVKRSLLYPLLTAFDFPDVDTSCEARFITVQPVQALTMLNGEFANAAADQLARRITRDGSHSPNEQVARAVELALNRSATEEEIAEGLGLLNRLEQHHGVSPEEALSQWCLVVLNLSEFMYID